MKTAVVFASVAAGMPGEYIDAAGGAPYPDAAPAPGPYPAVDPVGSDYTGQAPAVDPAASDYTGQAPVDVYDDYVATDPAGAAPVYDDYGSTGPVDVPSYGGAVDPVDVPYYGGDLDPVDIPSYGGDVSPTGGDYPYQTPYAGDIGYDDIDDVWLYDDIPYAQPTDVYDGCAKYDYSDYDARCIDPVDVDDLPVCTPVTEVDYVTVTKGEPECKTVYDTKYITDYCDEIATECVYETQTYYDECDPITTTVTIPSKYETVCKGTQTAPAKTFYDYWFTYSYTYVHPIVYHTSTVYDTPLPDIKTSYTEEHIKVTKTETETKYDTTTIKTTPVVTKTVYDGCETVYEYKTYYPEPVVEKVEKTIYVPVGCVDPVDACVDPISGGDYGAVDPIDVTYGGDVDPIDVKPSYGGDVYDDQYVDPIDVSYGGVDPVDGGDYGAVDPVADDYQAVDPVADYPDVDPVAGDYGAAAPIDIPTY